MYRIYSKYTKNQFRFSTYPVLFCGTFLVLNKIRNKKN